VPEDIVIHTTRYCFYCLRAKHLLAKRGLAFREVDLSGDTLARSELAERTGTRRVPQIFIDGNLVGGYQELVAMDRHGGLDALISGQKEPR
jgi:glutaredoxin 3